MEAKSIRIRIVAPFVFIVTLLLTGLGWLNYSDSQSQLEQQLQNQVNNNNLIIHNFSITNSGT